LNRQSHSVSHAAVHQNRCALENAHAAHAAITAARHVEEQILPCMNWLVADRLNLAAVAYRNRDIAEHGQLCRQWRQEPVPHLTTTSGHVFL
jgi:hypothetical protein